MRSSHHIQQVVFNTYTDGPFSSYFFQILCFGTEKIFEQNVVEDKPLNNDTKIAFYCSNTRWNNNAFIYHHYYYIYQEDY